MVQSLKLMLIKLLFNSNTKNKENEKFNTTFYSKNDLLLSLTKLSNKFYLNKKYLLEKLITSLISKGILTFKEIDSTGIYIYWFNPS